MSVFLASRPSSCGHHRQIACLVLLLHHFLTRVADTLHAVTRMFLNQRRVPQPLRLFDLVPVRSHRSRFSAAPSSSILSCAVAISSGNGPWPCWLKLLCNSEVCLWLGYFTLAMRCKSHNHSTKMGVAGACETTHGVNDDVGSHQRQTLAMPCLVRSPAGARAM